MIDHEEADDKIVAVLARDFVWGKAEKIEDLPRILIERLWHYFSTYKLIPGEESQTRIARVYDTAHADLVIRAAMADYEEAFGTRES